MASESQVQTVIHKLEEGGWAKWVWTAVLLVAIAYVCYAWFFKDNGFKGLSHPRAFEQAEIAREIARGNGFTTRMIRPAELWLFRDHNRTFSTDHIQDTYHAPLWPAILSQVLGIPRVRQTWPMTEHDVQYVSDKVIAATGLLFFLLSVLVNFFVARKLFDLRLALIGMGLLLVCDHLWRFSLTGLPQMLMLFLFSLAILGFLQVEEIWERYRQELEAEEEAIIQERGTLAPGDEELEYDSQVPVPLSLTWWSLGIGAVFGLLALSHAITIWVLAGLVTYILFAFVEARLRIVLPIVLMSALLYAPWMVRNYHVCGTPVGVSWYAGLYQIRGTEGAIMRSKESPINGATPTMFYHKVVGQIFAQGGNLISYLGHSPIAPIFFITLLHLFRRRTTARFRWAVLLMWLFALLGMAVLGLDDEAFKANDLHVLFIPLMTFYGLAYVLVLWSRLEVRVRLVQIGFIVLLYLLCGAGFFFTLLDLHGQAMTRVQWPPYVPPYIAVLASWTTDKEVLMSDMPWAVAWYADRKCLWLPWTIEEFNELNDYNRLGGPIVGMYLTPVSGDEPFLGGIVKGDYKAWQTFIIRNANLRNFPLKAGRVMPLDNQCVFYADRDRWTLHED